MLVRVCDCIAGREMFADPASTLNSCDLMVDNGALQPQTYAASGDLFGQCRSTRCLAKALGAQ